MKTPEIAAKVPKQMTSKAGTYNWCACGKSESQPFCDGSHKGSTFVPVRVTIDKDSTVNWCMCKHTKAIPFCDGTHKSL